MGSLRGHGARTGGGGARQPARAAWTGRPLSLATAEPGAWPAADLEGVGACPVCEDAARTALYEGLEDRVFGTAPGTWSLSRCTGCGSAFLDPRPTPASIGRAYERYYTHEEPDPERQPTGPLGTARRRLRNGYLSGRYGSAVRPASRLGPLLVPLLPTWRGRASRLVRGLRHPGNEAPALLDVGCGNGAFLAFMQDRGWRVRGLDPDPRAVALARERGLDVRVGSLVEDTLAEEAFDAVTMSHVLEHLHDPLGVLRLAWRSLRPGGVMSIATPNLESAGHRRFGRHWMPLDAPRHLALFTPASLALALERTGFEPLPHPPVVLQAREWIWAASCAVAGGGDPFCAAPLSLRLEAAAALADLSAVVRRGRAEELRVLARRPE